MCHKYSAIVLLCLLSLCLSTGCQVIEPNKGYNDLNEFLALMGRQCVNEDYMTEWQQKKAILELLNLKAIIQRLVH